MPSRNPDRSLIFASRPNNQYWWHHRKHHNYVPPVYAFLTDTEWNVLERWFDQVAKDFPNGPGQCGIPAMSLIQGLIMGSGINRVVQCGHYAGYSTLLLGFMMRKMGFRRSLFSVDIDARVTEYTYQWLQEADLLDYVNLHVGNSTDKDLPDLARAYFGNQDICLVFIDSSHQYQHTLNELDLWYEQVCPGGFVLLHDVSRFASAFDASQQGGVLRAVTEWTALRGVGCMLINGDCVGGMEPVYSDCCGLGIIQKPLTQSCLRANSDISVFVPPRTLAECAGASEVDSKASVIARKVSE